MLISRSLLPLIAILLSECGAEVVSTTVTVGKLQADQAQHAIAQVEQFKTELSAAMKATEEAVSAASTTAGQ